MVSLLISFVNLTDSRRGGRLPKTLHIVLIAHQMSVKMVLSQFDKNKTEGLYFYLISAQPKLGFI
jgi:hypothetical protein